MKMEIPLSSENERLAISINVCTWLIPIKEYCIFLSIFFCTNISCSMIVSMGFITIVMCQLPLAEENRDIEAVDANVGKINVSGLFFFRNQYFKLVQSVDIVVGQSHIIPRF